MVFWFFHCFDVLINSMLLAILCSDIPEGDNSLAKYFANSYDAVPMLDIIGHNEKLLIVLLTGILCFFGVP